MYIPLTGLLTVGLIVGCVIYKFWHEAREMRIADNERKYQEWRLKNG